MLLLSSATRILATELPPRAPHTNTPPRLLSSPTANWSIGGWGRQRTLADLVSEGNLSRSMPQARRFLNRATRERSFSVPFSSCWRIPSSDPLLHYPQAWRWRPSRYRSPSCPCQLRTPCPPARHPPARSGFRLHRLYH